MRTILIVSALLATLLGAGPARADHKLLISDESQTDTVGPDFGAKPEVPKPEGMKTESSVDINLKLGINGFSFGSKVFGREGYTGGAWLNGQTRPEGFSVDGRVERDGKAHNFKMNIELDEWLRRAARWWTRGQNDL
jgi:hypothetical protein